MVQHMFAMPWSIFTPTVYRMMRREYVERFFDTGELLVSSFAEFARHPDEPRQDKGEGWNIVLGRGSKSTVMAITGHGESAFVLCGSAIKDTRLMNRFQADAAIQIHDTTAFASAVARHLPGARGGFEGHCVYNDLGIECDIGDFEIDQLKSQVGGTTLDLNKLGGFALNMSGLAVFFRKATKYRDQAEYRWVWMTERPVAGPMVVRVPEARKFCSSLLLSRLEGEEQVIAEIAASRVQTCPAPSPNHGAAR